MGARPLREVAGSPDSDRSALDSFISSKLSILEADELSKSGLNDSIPYSIGLMSSEFALSASLSKTTFCSALAGSIDSITGAVVSEGVFAFCSLGTSVGVNDKSAVFV